MATLDPRNDSFISLLVDVSGRARPEDMNGVSPEDAAALLQAYSAAHPEKGLVWDGKTLAYGAAPAAPAPDAPAPAPEPFVEPAVVEPTVPEVAYEPVAAQPAADLDAVPAYEEAPVVPEMAFEPAPAAEYEPVPVPEYEPAPAAAVEFEPAPAAAVEFEPAPAAAFEYEPAPTAVYEPAEVPTYEPEPAPADGTSPALLDATAIPYAATVADGAAEVPASELPSWMFEGESPQPAAESTAFDPAPAPSPSIAAAPSHEAVFAAAPAPSAPMADSSSPSSGDYGVPQAPAPGGYYGVSQAAPPEYEGSAASDYAPVGDYVPSGGNATMDYVMSAPVGPQSMPTRVNGLWWIAVLLFGVPGAFVAWFVNRGRTGAKAFLWVGIIGLALLALVFAATAIFGTAVMLDPTAAPTAP